MVNATLFYKITAGENPATIPAGRRIDFDSSGNKSFSPLKLDYANNIKQVPNPQNLGVRQINVTENGLKDANFPVGGFIKLTEPDHTKLKEFMILPQITTALPFGRFGIIYPNATLLGFDPNATKGLSIGPATLEHDSTNKAINFTYTMLFGGTFV